MAVNRLRRLAPALSADVLLSTSQVCWLLGLMVLTIVLALRVPDMAVSSLALLVSLPFASIVMIRVHALAHFLTRRRPRVATRIPAHSNTMHLPTYSILVPLYREARVVGALMEALRKLDYPATHLEIFFITEHADRATRAALVGTGLSANMRVITVPEGLPRTKPRALNYALTYARGDYVAVFDAEDAPEPGQLKMAVRAFRTRPGPVGCVQARLDIYTPPNTFIVKQFTLEYLVLFHALLPAYQKLGLPMPLGGTSNHFPRALLETAGGWDPWNVTEDADLGVRLARKGYKVAMIGATTWEEAPIKLSQWFGQRTRWIKGWIQTYLVHMRAPLQLWRDLGPAGFCGFQLVFAGMLASALVHPFALLLICQHAAIGGLFVPGESQASALMSYFCLLNLVASYVAAALTGLAVAIRRRRLRLLGPAILVPAYWLLISMAAYAAVIDIVRRPHYWRKTRHLGAGRERVDAATGRASQR